MNRRAFAASVLSTAVGLALTMQSLPTQAQETGDVPQVVKDNMARMQKNKLEKCYGINVAAKNDCAEGAHSCAGQATQARGVVLARGEAADPRRKLSEMRATNGSAGARERSSSVPIRSRRKSSNGSTARSAASGHRASSGSSTLLARIRTGRPSRRRPGV